MRREQFLKAVSGLTLGVGLLALSACDRPVVSKFNGVDLTGASYARELSLQDPTGAPRSLADFRGKVLVVFFGFTQCPDVCPTTLGEVRAVREALGAQGADVVPIFVSVDPERDTPELLRNYVAAFGDGVVGLRGTPEQTQAATREFKVFAKKVVDPKDPTGKAYSIDHTAASFLFDRQGRVRVYARYGMGTEALLADLKTLLAEQ